MEQHDKRDVLALAEREGADEVLSAEADPLSFRWDAPFPPVPLNK